MPLPRRISRPDLSGDGYEVSEVESTTFHGKFIEVRFSDRTLFEASVDYREVDNPKSLIELEFEAVDRAKQRRLKRMRKS